MECSVAQALEVVGERWTLLIIRDCLMGVTQFDTFQRRLGVARNILSRRLDDLVSSGVLERVRYQERPPRYEYLLTPKGRELWVVLTALRQWGDRWAVPDGAPIEAVHACGAVSAAQLWCPVCREPLALADVSLREGPGAVEGGLLPVTLGLATTSCAGVAKE